jgi:GT2 family glycosyltransferase
MDLTIPEGLEFDGHCINDGDSWGRINRLLTTYRNLLVFGTIYDTDIECSYTARKAVERNIKWSTEDAVLHHYHSNWADGLVFVRRDFLDAFGGYPEGVGHGGQKFDMCRRAMKFGAVIGMFRDIPYLHYGTGNIQRKERHSGIDPAWYSYNYLQPV